MDDPSSPLPTSHDLVLDLTNQIREHAVAARDRTGYGARISHLVACGKALAELKKLLKHGRWGKWVQEQCGFSRMTANRYMRLADRRAQVTRIISVRRAYVDIGVIKLKPDGSAPKTTSSIEKL